MQKKRLNSLDVEAFLEYKTLYYDKIDFSVVKNAWLEIKPHITIPYVIHVVGTNGKGTTGRFLAHYLYQLKKNVLHYSSPHIQTFHERIWINGGDVDSQTLQKAHEKLLTILNDESLEKLTYFEYATLLSLLLSSGFDYIVLEAGLGGEFDATNVVRNDLSLITTIGLDHQSFLGDTIEAIALTKMRSVDNVLLLGHQVDSKVCACALEIQKQKENPIQIINANMNYDLTELEINLPHYLKNNLKLAISALNFLKFEIDLHKFRNLKLTGRCEKIGENITIDVGHNPLAAQEIVKEFLPKKRKIILVYNAYEDKDYKKVLQILKPIIKRVEILPLEDKRVVKGRVLNKVCDKLNIISGDFKKLDTHQEYLVFGSFLVVEEFLNIIKECNEK